MQKFFICVLTLSAFSLTEWAYAQGPGNGHQQNRPIPVIRGQAEPARQRPATPEIPDFKGSPAPQADIAPPPRPVIAPPPPAPTPPPAPKKSFLQVCLPFLTLGIVK